MTQTLSVTDAKARLSELVAAVSTTHDYVEITRNGEPAAVLISPHELDALRETIAILSDPGAVAQIRESEAGIAAGRLTDDEDVREAMLARRRRGQ
jgi:prevent-host-death family protein